VQRFSDFEELGKWLDEWFALKKRAVFLPRYS